MRDRRLLTMGSRRGMLGWSVATILIAGLAGCADGGRSTDPRPEVSATRTADPSKPTAKPAKILEARKVQSSLEVVDDTVSQVSVTGVGAKYLVTPNESARLNSTREHAYIVRRTDGRRVATFNPSKPGQLLFRVLFWKDLAVIQETTNCSNGSEGCRISLFLIDLGSGKQTRLTPTGGRPLGFLGAADMKDNVVAVAATKDGPHDDRCVLLFNVETGDQREATCFDPGSRIFSIRAGEAGFSVMYAVGETIAECRVVEWIALTDAGSLATDAPRGMGHENNCLPFDHTHHSGWDVWSDIPEERNAEVDHSGGSLTAANGTKALDLGPVETNTTYSCGDHIYWQRRDPTRSAVMQLLRWRPGAGTTEIVYEHDESEDAGYIAMNMSTCTDGTVSFALDRPKDHRPAFHEVHALNPA